MITHTPAVSPLVRRMSTAELRHELSLAAGNAATAIVSELRHRERNVAILLGLYLPAHGRRRRPPS